MISDMKTIILCWFVLVCSFVKAQSVSGTYTGVHYRTWYSYTFNEDYTMEYESSGHGGFGKHFGTFILSGDTVVVQLTQREGVAYTEAMKLLIESDSSIIDLFGRWDYRKNQSLFSSTERLVKYPQVQGSLDSAQQSDLKAVLEAILSDTLVTKYYHFKKLPKREFTIQGYYAVNSNFPLNVEVDGKRAEIIVKASEKCFIEIEDVNQNETIITVEFRIPEEGVSGTAVYKKVDGTWVKMYIPIREN